MNVARFHAAVGIALSFLVGQPCAASISSCGGAPRIVGAFGAENNPAAPISIPEGIRSQLQDMVAARQMLNTQLSPSGEQAIVYDTATDESDPHPKVAFVVGGRVAKVLDGTQMAGGRGGPVRYLAGCQFDAAKNLKAVALAFSTAFDGSGSAFDIIMWRSGDYRVVFDLYGMQGQLVLGRDVVALWTSDGMGECTWCPQHYEIRRYAWQNARYVKTAISKVKKSYDPTIISSVPLRFANTTEGN